MVAKRLISILVSAFLATQPISGPLFAQPTPLNAPLEQDVPASPLSSQRDNVESLAALTDAIREKLDRTAFDFDALLDELDFDVDKIISFSKKEIAFEQYAGILRGAKGVLFSRAGNSIDQSLLLAKLLRDAGYDARIVGAELTRDQAREVLRAMKEDFGSPPAIADPGALLDVLREVSGIGEDISDEVKRAFYDYVNFVPRAENAPVHDQILAITEFLTRQLHSRKLQFDGEHVQEQLLREAQQYFWVQYKESASAPWSDVHPLFRTQPTFQPPEPGETYSGALPERLQHRLRFQVFIERKIGDRLEVVPITSGWERPVANMVGTQLVFANVADSMLGVNESALELDVLLKRAKSFVPTFGAGVAPGAKFFDLRGNVIDSMAAARPASGIFSEVNRAFGEAIGGLAGEGAIPTLTAQWMEFVLIAPDGTESTFRRTTFDRIGAAARKSNTVPTDLTPTTLDDVRPLIQRHTFGLNVGRIPRGFGIDSAAVDFEQWEPEIKRALEYGAEDGAVSLGARRNPPVGWGGLWALFSILDQADTIGKNHRSYRSAPGLLIHSEGLGSDQEYLERIDIVSNSRRVLDISGITPAIDPIRMVEAGVWETMLEGTFISGSDLYSTTVAFDAAAHLGSNPVVISSPASLNQISASADTLAAIESDLVRGYVVIAPSAEPSTGRSGWWRIDPQTGETLGQILDGRGAVTTEEAILLSISVVFLGLSMWQCMQGQRARNQTRPPSRYFWDNQGVCCMVGNAGISWIGSLAGVFLLTTHKFSTSLVIGMAAGASVGFDVAGYNLPIDEFCGVVMGN